MSDYTVRMVMGNDTCTTITTVTADSAPDAAIIAQLKWTGITVRVVDVADSDGCCYTTFDCTNDDHFCNTCDSHLDDDGTCANCHYDI